MLVVVKKPRIEIRSKRMPVSLMKFIRSEYKPGNVVVEKENADDEDLIPFDETDFHKKICAEMTPGKAINAARGLCGWTQAVLAEKLGVPVQNVSEMERGKRVVSKKMAVALGKIFGCGPSAFFEFPDNL